MLISIEIATCLPKTNCKKLEHQLQTMRNYYEKTWENTADYASCGGFCESCSFQRKNVHYKIMVVITKSHCCDSQTAANGFIGNAAVTFRRALTTFSIAAVSVLACVLFNNNDSCMPCDINFKSQDHLKKLGPAVEIMGVHTDLHSHKIQSRVSLPTGSPLGFGARCFLK